MKTFHHSRDRRYNAMKTWLLLLLFSIAASLFSLQLNASPLLPQVELSSFVGKQIKNQKKAILYWSCNSQTDNKEFVISRSKDRINWVAISSMRGSGTTNSPKDYSFEDEEVDYGHWFYKLDWLDNQNNLGSRVIEVSIRQPFAIAGRSIELLKFKGKAFPDHSMVLLKWSVNDETNNDYYTIYRSRDRKNWSKIGFQDGQGNSTSQKVYTFYDSEALLGTIFYKLEWTDMAGEKDHQELEITNGDLESVKNLSRTSKTSISSFIAENDEELKYMKIRWKANPEKGLRDFILLHSTDRNTWKSLDHIVAEGSSEEFQIKHAGAPQGTNYYKLMWFDQDDSYSFSTISADKISEDESYSLFPNPATTRISIQTKTNPGFGKSVVVFNTHGGEYEVPATYMDGQMNLELESIPKGIYIVKMPKGFVRFQKD